MGQAVRVGCYLDVLHVRPDVDLVRTWISHVVQGLNVHVSCRRDCENGAGTLFVFED